ncbi:natriuretic peptides A [Pelobates cultripes]|uniref:Natriuretic peptides A n=1 Tax=Pelobates cultripes TaxID=61616 RepID=A0AAD1WMR8_PELCU|nr:natriuretic peptides A [Pelobates cultripes]
MGALFVQYTTFAFLLLAVMESIGSPAYGSILSSDLSDLKDILSRLEDKLPSEDVEAPSPDLFAQNYDTVDLSNSAPSWTGEASRPQSDLAYNKGSWGPPDKLSPLKNKLRELLNVPRSMRRSDCFGSRIDKIGAQSGMGCNSRRF